MKSNALSRPGPSCISGEHPDWDEYRVAMRAQNKSLVRITVARWGPVATGGFPPEQDG